MDKKIVIAAIITAAALIVVGVAAVLVLNKGGSEGGTVKYVVVAPSQMDAWLASNQSDAFIAWEPFASSAVVAGTGRALMWSSEIMPNHPCCVVVASKSFIAGTSGTELTKRFLKAHIEANEWIADALAHESGANYSLLVNMSSVFTSRSNAVVEEGLSHVKYGYQMNAAFRDALVEFTQMYINADWITNQTLNTRGYATAAGFVDDYVNETYLAEADAMAPSATIINPTSPIRLGFLSGDLHQIAQIVAQNKTVGGGSKSLFEQYGVNVQPQTAYANGGYEMDGFIAGNLDIGYLGAPPAILKRLNLNANTVIVAQANSEGSAIVVASGSDIHSLSDLVGRTVATPGETSIQHLLLSIALDRQGIALVKG